jgi:hypothetical protein
VLVRFLAQYRSSLGEASALRVARLDLLRRRVTVASALPNGDPQAVDLGI